MKYGYIYLTYCTVTGKIYIGQKKSNKFIRYYKGSGIQLRLALEKYGKDKFNTYLIDWYNSREQLDSAEIYWIRKYNSNCNSIGYNIASGGLNDYPYKGMSIEELSKVLQKRSENLKGRKAINNGIDEKLVKLEELDLYFKNGWRLGRIKNAGAIKGKKSIFKDEEIIAVKKEELESYLNEGWQLGNPKLLNKPGNKSFLR